MNLSPSGFNTKSSLSIYNFPKDYEKFSKDYFHSNISLSLKRSNKNNVAAYIKRWSIVCESKTNQLFGWIWVTPCFRPRSGCGWVMKFNVVLDLKHRIYTNRLEVRHVRMGCEIVKLNLCVDLQKK
jgi:hypothetical protein